MVLNELPILYRRDSQDRLRFWGVEVDGGSYRTRHGIVDGEVVHSGWTHCTPRSQPTAEAQALFEAKALVAHKVTRRYHLTKEECFGRPNFFAPMLAKDYHDYAPKGRVRFPVYEQPKLDGMRCIATVEGLFSRQGRPITSCPHVSRALGPLFREDPDLVLDGELYSHEYRHDFEKIISVARRVMDARKHSPADVDAALVRSAEVIQYHVYDVPSAFGGFDARYRTLRDVLFTIGIEEDGSGPVRIVRTWACGDQELLDERRDAHLADGYEGQMVRILGVPYEVGKRSPSLLKRKEFRDVEVTIRRVIEGTGSWTSYAKSVEYSLDSGAKLESGEHPCAGIAGDQEFTRRLLREAEAWVGRRCTIKYQKLSARGIPMFPIATKFHADDGRPGRD